MDKYTKLALIERLYQDQIHEAEKFGFDVTDPAIQAQCRKDAEIEVKHSGKKISWTAAEKSEAEKLLQNDTLE